MFPHLCDSWRPQLTCLLQDETGSTLTIDNVSVEDSGNYSCQPRDLRPDSVLVTILSERQAPDALQDKTTHTSSAARTALPGA